MTHLLVLAVCVAVCGAACSSNTPTTHCETEIECWEIITPEAAGPGASLSIADAGPDAPEGGVP